MDGTLGRVSGRSAKSPGREGHPDRENADIKSRSQSTSLQEAGQEPGAAIGGKARREVRKVESKRLGLIQGLTGNRQSPPRVL